MVDEAPSYLLGKGIHTQKKHFIQVQYSDDSLSLSLPLVCFVFEQT